MQKQKVLVSPHGGIGRHTRPLKELKLIRVRIPNQRQLKS